MKIALCVQCDIELEIKEGKFAHIILNAHISKAHNGVIFNLDHQIAGILKRNVALNPSPLKAKQNQFQLEMEL